MNSVYLASLKKCFTKHTRHLYTLINIVLLKHKCKSKEQLFYHTSHLFITSHVRWATPTLGPCHLSISTLATSTLSYIFSPSSFCRRCSQPQVPSGRSSLCGITLQKWWMCSQSPSGTRNLNSDPVTAAAAYFEKYISPANPFYCSESSSDKSARRAPSLSTFAKINRWNEERGWFLWSWKKNELIARMILNWRRKNATTPAKPLKVIFSRVSVTFPLLVAMTFVFSCVPLLPNPSSALCVSGLLTRHCSSSVYILQHIAVKSHCCRPRDCKSGWTLAVADS